MEEKILQMLGYGLTITDYMCGIDGVDRTAKDITSLFTAFTIWKDSHKIKYSTSVDRYMYEGMKTLDGLFDYWLNNIHNK